MQKTRQNEWKRNMCDCRSERVFQNAYESIVKLMVFNTHRVRTLRLPTPMLNSAYVTTIILTILSSDDFAKIAADSASHREKTTAPIP